MSDYILTPIELPDPLPEGLGIDTTTLHKIVDHIKQHENDLLNQVVRMVLKREPLPADFQRFNKAQHPKGPGTYKLMFDGIHIGNVNFVFDGTTQTINFQPVHPFN